MLALVLLGVNAALLVLLVRAMWARSNSDGADAADADDATVAVVVAHPDDEVLFFGPTLWALRERGRRVRVLSLTAPGARVHELRASGAALGAASVVAGPWPDGPHERWDEAALDAWLRAALDAVPGRLKSVVTFDSGGVSGHPNHVACGEAVARVHAARPHFHLLRLRTVPLWRRYLGALDAVASVLLLTSDMWLVAPAGWRQPLVLWRHMSAHYGSQWVWYRKLMVLASRYTFINTFDVINARGRAEAPR